MPFNSETAVVAGKKGSVGKGRYKTQDRNWMYLGKKITGSHAQKINKHMDTLWKEGRHEEFFDAYLKLLQYFKPKVMAHAVKTQTEVIFRFESDDRQLFEDV